MGLIILPWESNGPVCKRWDSEMVISVSEVMFELRPALGRAGKGCPGQRSIRAIPLLRERSCMTRSKKASKAGRVKVMETLGGHEQGLELILSLKRRADSDLRKSFALTFSCLPRSPPHSGSERHKRLQVWKWVWVGERGGSWGFSWRQGQPSARKVKLTGDVSPVRRARLPRPN